MNTDFVNQIVQRKADQDAAQKEAVAAKIQSFKEQVLTKFRALVGDEFWNLIDQPRTKILTHMDSSFLSHIEIDVPAFDDLQLAPISIYLNVERHHHMHIFNVEGYDYDDLDSAIAAARKRYPNYRKDLIEAQTRAFVKGLTSMVGWESCKTVEDAQAAHAKLIEIDPTQTATWDAHLSRWIEVDRIYQERLAQEAREKAERAEKNAVLQAVKNNYLEALIEQKEANEQIEKINAARAEIIQAELDKTKYTVSLLEYAIMATEEETQDKFVETRGIYVLGQAPDENGYWTVDTKGTIRKFSSIISVEPQEVCASANVISKKINRHGTTIFFSPWHIDETIEAILSGLIRLREPIPDPENLTQNEIAYLKTKAYDSVYVADDDNDIPF